MNIEKNVEEVKGWFLHIEMSRINYYLFIIMINGTKTSIKDDGKV